MTPSEFLVAWTQYWLEMMAEAARLYTEYGIFIFLLSLAAAMLYARR